MPENIKFKEEKHREYIVKTEAKDAAVETPTASKKENNIHRKTMPVGMARYASGKPLAELRSPR